MIKPQKKNRKAKYSMLKKYKKRIIKKLLNSYIVYTFDRIKSITKKYGNLNKTIKKCLVLQVEYSFRNIHNSDMQNIKDLLTHKQMKN